MYRTSFLGRYGEEPYWSVKENSQAKRLIGSVGLQEALWLVENYLKHTDEWTTKRRHNLGDLLANPTKYKLEIKNPRRILDSHVVSKQLEQIVVKQEGDRKLEEDKTRLAKESERRDRIATGQFDCVACRDNGRIYEDNVCYRCSCEAGNPYANNFSLYKPTLKLPISE